MFCFKNELTATETFEMRQKVYGNECLSPTNIFEWYGMFRNDRKSVDDNLRAERPRTSWTPEHIAKVHAALGDDLRSTIRMLAEWFHIDKETICKIITEDLGGKKLRVCNLFPPCWRQNNEKNVQLLVAISFKCTKMIRNFRIKLSQAMKHGVLLTTQKTSLWKVVHQNHVNGFFSIPDVSSIKNLFQLDKQLMLTFIKMFWIISWKELTAFFLICARLDIGFLSMTMHRPIIRHQFVNFWPKKMLQSFITHPICQIWLRWIISYSRN